MADHCSFPVVDLFAGPGGLGEGFASYTSPEDNGRYAFHTAISIEKDADAHSTLELRHFFRAFPQNEVPDNYYRYLRGEISRENLFQLHPAEAASAKNTAWQCTLGEEPRDSVMNRISEVVGNSEKWVLVGGPPCQAYSLVGRSRMMGSAGFESDPRHFLYKEYLRILADHHPPVFVMENVKGLLSAKVNGHHVIDDILQDLNTPARAVYQVDNGPVYNLFSLSQPGLKTIGFADPGAFVVRAEDYGIPQARHRIFVVGVREDIRVQPNTLVKAIKRNSVSDAIADLPPLRSGVSRMGNDSYDLWLQVLSDIRQHPWLRLAPNNPAEASIAETAERTLESLAQKSLERSNRTHTRPNILHEWFSDERLDITLSHESRSHMPTDLHRYLYAAIYASVRKTSPNLSDFPETLLPLHKNVEKGRQGEMFNDRFRVQLKDAPSTTITSHISKDGHYFIHYDPEQCRSLTVREAARLQTFPDNYKFEGGRTAQYHQVGNAVPPFLANQIAAIIYGILEKIN